MYSNISKTFFSYEIKSVFLKFDVLNFHKTLFQPGEKTQMSLLVTWLIELYLNHLGKLKEEQNEKEYRKYEEIFRKFLAQVGSKFTFPLF